MEPYKDPKYIPGISRINNTFSVLFVFGVKFVFAYFDGGLRQRFLYLSGNLLLVTNLTQQQTSSENLWKNSST